MHADKQDKEFKYVEIKATKILTLFIRQEKGNYSNNPSFSVFNSYFGIIWVNLRLSAS